MKKRIVLFTVAVGIGYISLSSYSDGPAFYSSNRIDRTGAQGSPVSCGSGTGCHGAGAGTSVSIIVDSAGSGSVTRYVPGMTYTINISATNTASNPKFGFQFASVSGSGVAQVQAGTAVVSSFPAHVYADTLSGLTFVEQGNALAATTAGNYNMTFRWTAPAVAVGNITLYCTLNAVNGNGNADASDISGNTSLTLTEEAGSVSASIASVPRSFNVCAFPNPTGATLTLRFDNDASGKYLLEVFNQFGARVFEGNVAPDGVNESSLNTTNWAPGIYRIAIEKDGIRREISVVKK